MNQFKNLMESECIETIKCKDRHGYGCFKINKKNILEHRYIWEQSYGIIPKNMCVLHHCDNPACINIEHLFLGTHADNVADKVSKNRQAKGDNHGRSKLNEKTVIEILCKIQNKEFNSIVEIAKKYKCSRFIISKIINGKNWKHITNNYDLHKIKDSVRPKIAKTCGCSAMVST